MLTAHIHNLAYADSFDMRNAHVQLLYSALFMGSALKISAS